MKRWKMGSLLFFGLLVIFPLWRCTPATTEEKTTEATPDGGLQEEKPQCIAPRDCPAQDCIAGKCVDAPSCTKQEDCDATKMCWRSRCVSRCEIDTDCPAEHVCTYGQCHKPVWKRGIPPNEGASQRKPLQAGLGIVPLDMPLGISMAGYGLRVGPTSPYAEALGASTGQYDRFYVKALALDDGLHRVILVRSPMCWVSDFLQTQIVQYIIEKTGIDFSKNLIITATHTHSGPARFWNLLPEKKLGFLGYDEFLPEAFRRIAHSFAEAIIAAHNDLKPAKLGYAVDKNFDPDDKIFSDRRGASPREKHGILTVIRVDREDGTPLAALMSFPMHGIIGSFNKFFLTQDAAGGLEMAFEEYAEERLGKRIEAFFMQGPAGDVSPRAGHLGHEDIQRMQLLGHTAAPPIWQLYQGITTKNDIPLGIVNQRVGISRKLIGYNDDEFYEEKDGKKMPYRFGGLKCVDQAFDYNKEPEKRHQDGKLGCVLVVEMLNDGAPIPQFTKTHLTVAKIGDLTLATFPGEATSFLGLKLRKALEERSGGKIKDLVVLGYSQDHHFYLLDEEDWWRGGYEASMNIWGPRFGDYILKHVTELALKLTAEKPTEETTGILPQDFYQLDLSPTVPREKTPQAGKIIQQPPSSYKRLDLPMRFILSGGFLGVDNPTAILQRQEGGSFRDVTINATGRLYDDSSHRIIMSYEKKDSEWHYSFWFEEGEGFPEGVYRFRVAGQQWDGEKIVPYQTETQSFTVEATDKLRLWGAALDAGSLRVFVGYPPASNDDGKTPFQKLERMGHRLRSTVSYWSAPSAITKLDGIAASITVSQGGTAVLSLSSDKIDAPQELDIDIPTARQADGTTPTERRKTTVSSLRFDLSSLPSGTYQIKITFTDAFNNQGLWQDDAFVIP